jgi:succinyl-CoA synthetase alpha subunit
MPVGSVVRSRLYKDSVVLMRLAETLGGMPGVRYASLSMGTDANKALLAEAGRLPTDLRAAGPDDLMLLVEADSQDSLSAALAGLDELLARAPAGQGGVAGERAPQSLGMALRRLAAANLAQISTPGPYAGAETLKALHRGLHVFLFSDNVPLEQEATLKSLAARKQLLVMGPDCGTALIHGVPLGFANVVRRGAIGLVAAAGTGLQQVTCLIHRLGEGVSHGIGTGSRDLSEAVGGVTFTMGLDALLADEATRVIGLLSKPPAPAVAARIADRLRGLPKPVVVLFLGGQTAAARAAGATPVTTLEEAAQATVALARGQTPPGPSTLPPATAERCRAEAERLAPSQRYLRALFSGGTFCSEAQVIWRQEGLTTYSNVPLDKAQKLEHAHRSREHTAIDMGTDDFTVGRPHPMIDVRFRVERLLQEAADPAVAVIQLDVVLGYGAHPDPAGALAPALEQARAAAARAGRHLVLVGSVCGTEEDPQRLSAQEERLTGAGVLLAPSNAAAARMVAAVVQSKRDRRGEL